MQAFIIVFIVLILLGIFPFRKRYRYASLMSVLLVTFLMGMVFGWF